MKRRNMWILACFALLSFLDVPLFGQINSGLVVYYPLDGNAYDNSGKGNHGIITEAIATADRCNIPGKALSLDGINDHIALSHNPSLDFANNSVWSVSFWFRTSKQEYQFGIDKYDMTSNVNGWGVDFRDGAVNARLNSGNCCTGATNSFNVVTYGVYNDGNWHHVGAIFDATAPSAQEAIIIGIDGQVQPTYVIDGVYVANQNYNTGSPITIGETWMGCNCLPGNYFAGDLDEIRIYSRALSQAEVRQLSSSECPDTTPPEIKALSATPNVLWSPNHKMVPVTLSTTVTDNLDSAPAIKIISVSSNEPMDPDGDWEITGDLTLKLRAERLGNGTGRIYTITCQATDSAGNSTLKTVTVTVPHDQRGK